MTATFERHPIDLTALVFGATFQVIGLAALAHQLDWIELSSRRWFGMVVLAIGIAGAIGVLASAVRSTRRRSDVTAPTVIGSPASDGVTEDAG
jgi:hypothetical protein